MKPFIRTSLIASALTLLGTPAVHAAEDSNKPDSSISGYIDTYYSYNFNDPKQVAAPSATSVSAAGLPPANNTYRYYDVHHNEMTLSLAEITVQAKYREVSGLVDLDFGSFADLNATSSSAAGPIVDETSKHIGQATISYRPSNSRFFFDAGKMYSHLGVETVKAKDNFNYSRSVLFSYGMPFWNTGVRLGYDVVPSVFQTSVYVYNGWNTLHDTNRSKTLGVQFRYTPSSSVAIVYNFLGGPERTDSESDWKSLHELNATLALSERWGLIADLIYGSEENAPVGTSRVRAKWYGGLIGARYQLNQSSYLSPRFEIYRDNDGYSLGAAAQTIQSATLTYGKELTKGLELRSEVRSDFSNEATFVGGSGNKKSQTTALAALLFKF